MENARTNQARKNDSKVKTFFTFIADGTLIGIAVWFIAQIGFLISFFTYELGGQFIAPIFYVLAGWPNFVFSLFLPEELPTDYYQSAYLISCMVSLWGWVSLGCLFAYARNRRRVHKSAY